MHVIFHFLSHWLWNLDWCKGRNCRQWKSLWLRLCIDRLHEMDYIIRTLLDKCSSSKLINGWKMPSWNTHHIFVLYRCNHLSTECIMGMGSRMAWRTWFCWFCWRWGCSYGQWVWRISSYHHFRTKTRSDQQLKPSPIIKVTKIGQEAS